MLSTNISQSDLDFQFNMENIRKAFAKFLPEPVWVCSNMAEGKMPYSPVTPGKAKSNDPATWGTFSQAQSFIEKNPGYYPAIALSAHINLVAIDLDDCIDANGCIKPWAQRTSQQIQSYTERSISGFGLHIFAEGKKPGNKCKKSTGQQGEAMEMYEDKKFITLTGDIVPEKPVEIRYEQDGITKVYNETFNEKETVIQTENRSPSMTDDNIISLCRKAKNAAKFTALYDKGDLSAHADDHSAADLALLSIISFYTQDSSQLDRLFRSSKLMRDKWEREDYRNESIKTAITNLRSIYKGTDKVNTSWETPEKIGQGEDLDLPFPIDVLPTVLRDIVEEVSRYNHVDPALVVLPALGIAALQIGKKAFIEEKKGLKHHPSLFLCGVAASGERKSSCYDAVLEGIKDAIESEMDEYKQKKANVRAHNELIKEQVTNIKTKLKNAKIDLATANAHIQELYNSEKDLPAEPFNFGDDLTPPRLFQKLEEHQGAYGIFSADARGIIKKIIGKGSKDGTSEETMYIAGMWGDDISRSRVGNNKGLPGGEDLLIRKPALTTVCFVQPDLWEELSKDPRMRQSGLISRINVVIPKSQMGTRLETENDVPLDRSRITPFTEAVKRLRAWEAQGVVVTLSKEAAKCRRDFFNTIEKELGCGGSFEDVKDIATKATSLAARLALIFTMFDIAAKGEIPQEISPVEEEQWLRAQALQEYFLSQSIDAQRTYGKGGATHLLGKVAQWLQKQVNQGKGTTTTASQAAKGIRGITTAELEEKLFPRLIEACWLRQVGVIRGGKPLYEVNPRIADDNK